MKIFKILSIVNLFIVLFIPPTPLLAQEDVSVEFTFNKPNEYVLEIRNMSDYRMTIWFNKEEADIHSYLYIYVEGSRKSTMEVYYNLWDDPDLENLIVRLEPDKAYRISYKTFSPDRWVMARIVVKYFVNAPDPRGGFYKKTIDLNEVRNKANIPIVVDP